MNAAGRWRATVAEVSAGAIRSNCAAFVRLVAPARVCAVVKADGYGHGAVTAARAAVAGGASMLGVALVEEGLALRAAGVTEPVLVLSEPPVGSLGVVVDADLDVTVYSAEVIDALAGAAASAGRVANVHLKVDTGMHRVGVAPEWALALARQIEATASLRLAGTCTHFAVADEPDSGFTSLQLERFLAVVGSMRTAGIDPGIVHAANSAGALVFPSARLDMVRVGVSLYGNTPGPLVDPSLVGVALQPALALRSTVAHVQRLAAGETVSYGRTWTAPSDRVVATVPIGYADGVPRRLSSVGGRVLIGGRRCPIVGRITMDQLLVDLGEPGTAGGGQGTEVVLLGAQGAERITPWEWASLLDTIAYEITCGISARVPRVVV